MSSIQFIKKIKPYYIIKRNKIIRWTCIFLTIVMLLFCLKQFYFSFQIINTRESDISNKCDEVQSEINQKCNKLIEKYKVLAREL